MLLMGSPIRLNVIIILFILLLSDLCGQIYSFEIEDNFDWANISGVTHHVRRRNAVISCAGFCSTISFYYLITLSVHV